MIEKLFELGIAQGLGIFFFLFVVVGAGFWIQNNSFMKRNNERESRYIDTIDKLAESFKEVAGINQNVMELRKDIDESKNMIGRVLDRLPGGAS